MVISTNGSPAYECLCFRLLLFDWDSLWRILKVANEKLINFKLMGLKVQRVYSSNLDDTNGDEMKLLNFVFDSKKGVLFCLKGSRWLWTSLLFVRFNFPATFLHTNAQMLNQLANTLRLFDQVKWPMKNKSKSLCLYNALVCNLLYLEVCSVIVLLSHRTSRLLSVAITRSSGDIQEPFFSQETCSGIQLSSSFAIRLRNTLTFSQSPSNKKIRFQLKSASWAFLHPKYRLTSSTESWKKKRSCLLT